MNVAQETLGFRRPGLSPGLSLLMSAFALPMSPARFPTRLHRRTERSSTAVAVPSERSRVKQIRAGASRRTTRDEMNTLRWTATTRSFGYRLEPRYIFRAGRLDQ